MSFFANNNQISKEEFSLFRDYIHDVCGIAIPAEKAYLIETRLTKLMLDAGAETFGDFHDYIIANRDPSMRQKIINAITTNETLWFRDGAPWKVLEEEHLPRLVDALEASVKKRVRIWCAAVSTGQEAYSTAMCVDDYLTRTNRRGHSLSDFEILATDISSRVLDIAKKGVYDKVSIRRGLSEHYRAKYFEEQNSAWAIDPKIRDAVTFKLFNLLDNYRAFGQFDIIFCRYVLIYFSNAIKADIIRKMRDALSDGGILFTGNYVLYELFEDGFDTNHYGNLTYFTKRRR